MLTGSHPGRTDAEELTVFKSLGLAVEDLAAAELIVREGAQRGSRHARSSSDPLRRDRARPRDRSPARRSEHRSCASPSTGRPRSGSSSRTSSRSARSRSAAPRTPSVRRPTARSPRASSPRARATWRRESPGRRASSACPHGHRAGQCARRQSSTRSQRLGGTVVKVPYERWWEIMLTSQFDEAEGFFVHPVQNERVMAGNGTIGARVRWRIFRTRTRCSCPGAAAASSPGSRARSPPCGRDTLVYAVRARDAGAAVTAALEAGEPHEAAFQPSFVDGAARRSCCPQCGTAHGRCSPAPSRSRSTRPPPPSACSPSARA